MRSRTTLSIIVALAAVGFAGAFNPADAATRRVPSWDGRAVLRAHGGVSFPLGNFGSGYQTGFGVGGSIGYGVSEQVLISAGAAYHNFEHEVIAGNEASVTPLTIGVDYKIPSKSTIAPWFGGGFGVYHVALSQQLPNGVTQSESENNFGMNFGVGIGAPIGDKMLLGTGLKFHYVGGDNFIDTPFVTFQIGIAAVL